MTNPRILLWDIETSLSTVAVFQLTHNDYIDPSNLRSNRYIICASWKWLGEDKVHSVSVLNDTSRFTKDPYDDRHVCEILHKVLSSADVIVAHNGDAFDLKYAETRFLFHGLSPLPPITSIDTYKIAKSRFNFISNKLDFIGKFLKVGKKLPTTPGLWLAVLNGDRKAVKKMVTYNQGDVLLLERVFKKLKPYVSNHLNRELFGTTGCPRCGSQKVQSRGYHRAISRVYRRFQCQSCSGWFRAAVNDKSFSPKFRVL